MSLRYGLGDSVSISTYIGSLGEIGVNTTTKTIHIFDGVTAGGTSLAKSSEVGGGGGGSGSLTINKQTFTVGVGGTTILTLTNPYDSGKIDVYRNGVRLASGDFTETSSNIITLTSRANEGDVVEVQSFDDGLQTATVSVLDNLKVNSIGTVTKLHVGIATTFSEDLVVSGSARITGILSIGTGTITLNPSTNTIQVGTGITINATQGTITVSGSQIADASGNANYSGIVTATSFVKSGGTSGQFLKADGSIDSSSYATQTFVNSSKSITVGTRSGAYTQNAVGTGITIALRSGVGTASF